MKNNRQVKLIKKADTQNISKENFTRIVHKYFHKKAICVDGVIADDVLPVVPVLLLTLVSVLISHHIWPKTTTSSWVTNQWKQWTKYTH